MHWVILILDVLNVRKIQNCITLITNTFYFVLILFSLTPNNFFNLKRITFEIEDDPFEVKLRDNYAVCTLFKHFLSCNSVV